MDRVADGERTTVFGGRSGRMPGPFRRYERELKNSSFVYVSVGGKEEEKKKGGTWAAVGLV